VEGLSFRGLVEAAEGFDNAGRFQSHHQRWEEAHPNPNGQSYRQQAQTDQRAPFAEGNRGIENRREASGPQQDCEPRSGATKCDLNPNMLDVSMLPPTAMALLQQLMATLSDKGKAPEGEQELMSTELGAASKVDAPESSAQGEARGNSDSGKPLYCYRCLSRGHLKEECAVQLVCEICDSNSHVKSRCPMHKKAVKSFAMTAAMRLMG
jgi:hypothetical protein